MARKKTLIVDYQSQGKAWSLKLMSADIPMRTDLVDSVRVLAKKHGLVILNAKDPFGLNSLGGEEKRGRPRKVDSGAALLGDSGKATS